MVALRRTNLTRVFALLALVGLAAFLSFWGMFATVRLADIEVRHSLDPEPGGMPESWFWAWAVAGWLGLMAFLLFGMFALLTRGAARRREASGTRHD